MAGTAPVEHSAVIDDQFAIACVGATVLLRYSALVKPAQRWADAAAEAYRVLTVNLGEGGVTRRPSVQVIVGILTPGDEGLSPTAVATAGFEQLDHSENAAREAIADATGQQHAFELRGAKPGRKRMMIPMPAFRGSRWMALQIDSSQLAEVPAFANTFTRGINVFRTAVMASYEKCVVGAERREATLLDRLTVPQQAVAKLLLEGKTESEAGQILHRSKHTVHDHVKSIYAAFSVQSRVELVLRWTELMADSTA